MNTFQQPYLNACRALPNYTSANRRIYYYIDSGGKRKGPVEAYKLPTFGGAKSFCLDERHEKLGTRVQCT